ncbi:MAG: triose-phosphate isomerase [Planctomycetota bacterium]
MRTPYVCGNWKLNLDRAGARALATAIAQHRVSGVDVGLFPPAVYLDEVARAVAGSAVLVGGQNCCDEASGAFTGEVSAAMLKDVGATVVLLGHSERRHVYGETDELIQRKVHRALADGLQVMLCVGETLEERDSDQTESVVVRQMTAGLAGVGRDLLHAVSIAYEPVWAIGTGRTATPAQAGAVHRFARGVFAGLYDDAAAAAVRILYGGSVKADNAAELLADAHIDGALVGGASLRADSFLPIIDAALRVSAS